MNKSKILSLMIATVLTLGVSTTAFASASQKTATKNYVAAQSKKQVIVSKEKAVYIASKMLKMLDTDMKIEKEKHNLKLSADLNSNANKNEWCVQWKDSEEKKKETITYVCLNCGMETEVPKLFIEAHITRDEFGEMEIPGYACEACDATMILKDVDKVDLTERCVDDVYAEFKSKNR